MSIVHCAASFAALVSQQPSKGCFFYESDWLTWLQLWVLSQAEIIITAVFTLEKLCTFTKWQFPKLKMNFYSLMIRPTYDHLFKEKMYSVSKNDKSEHSSNYFPSLTQDSQYDKVKFIRKFNVKGPCHFWNFHWKLSRVNKSSYYVYKVSFFESSSFVKVNTTMIIVLLWLGAHNLNQVSGSNL